MKSKPIFYIETTLTIVRSDGLRTNSTSAVNIYFENKNDACRVARRLAGPDAACLPSVDGSDDWLESKEVILETGDRSYITYIVKEMKKFDDGMAALVL